MNVRLTTLSTAELEEIEVTMRDAALWLFLVGRYGPATTCRSLGAEASQTLLVREADARQYRDRQLSLAPPGAYDEPA